MIVHIETSISSHSWQHTVVDDLVQAMRQAISDRNPVVDNLIDEGFSDLSRSVMAEGLALPPEHQVADAAKAAFTKGAVVIEKVIPRSAIVFTLTVETRSQRCEIACNSGSNADLVMSVSSSTDDARLEKIELAATLHLAFHELELGDCPSV
jgi:hypothetical protein